jgi:sulfate transport system ATP-binding protein
VTTVLVTHDQEEALELSDRVVIMRQGRVEQIGTPEQVYHAPASLFVYQFLGEVNLFVGRVNGDKAMLGGLEVDLPGKAGVPGDVARLFIRPHLLQVHAEPTSDAFKATVVHINRAGPTVKIELLAEWGDPVFVEMSPERCDQLKLVRDAMVFISPQSHDLFVRE